jgi:hypothetical protein
MPRVPKVVVVKNPDGTFSSERTTSVSAEALNKGRETLIPTLIEGKQFSTKEATNFAVKSGLEFPSFDSPEKATAFAHERSKTGGAAKHGFLGKVRKMPSNQDVQKDFSQKARAVIKRSDATLARGSGASREMRAKAAKAKKSAQRVLKRREGGAAPQGTHGRQPGKTGKGDLLGGVKALLRMGGIVSSLPGKEKKNLKEVERKTQK